jgi:hypothetical protein
MGVRERSARYGRNRETAGPIVGLLGRKLLMMISLAFFGLLWPRLVGKRSVLLARLLGCRPHTQMLHRSFGARSAFDAFANSEHARDHISHESLCAKSNGQAEYARPASKGAI